MVTLDDQAGYGDKESNTFQDHEIENSVPIRLKARRGMVLRIIYVSSSKAFRSLSEFASSLRKSGAASADRSTLNRFCKSGGMAMGGGVGETKVVVFYAVNDAGNVLASLPKWELLRPTK